MLAVVFTRTDGMNILLLLWMGSYALIGQILLLRELLVILSGHELCLGILFASWLGGIFAGARVGGGLQRWIQNPLRMFVWVQTAAVFLAPVLVVTIRHLRAWIPSSPGVPLPLLPTLLASIMLVAPLSFLMGFLFPVACGMAKSSSEDSAKVIGRVYVLEAIGSMIGGGLLTYVLLPRMPALTILALAGAGILITCTAVMMHQGSRTAFPVGCLCVLWILCWITGGMGVLQERSIQARWATQHPGMDRLVTKDTQYQCLELGRLEDQYSIFGNGHILTTFPDPLGAAQVAHVVMNQTPNPQDILIVGGGPGSLPGLILGYPIRRAVLVELDAQVVHLAAPYLGPEERRAMVDKRAVWSFMDGRYLVKKLPPESLDAIILQVPDPSTALLNRFHTEEFYEDLSRILRPDGFVVTSITGSLNYVGPEIGGYMGIIYRTLKGVFPEVLLVPGDRALFLASNTPGMLTVDPDVLAQRFRKSGQASEKCPPEIFSFWIQKTQVQLWQNALASQGGPLNSDARPLAYFQYLTLWDLISSRKFTQSPLRYLMDVRFVWVLIFCIGVIILALIVRGQPERFRMPTFVIGITGFTGMAQEILCLYMYQSLQGYLYSRLGLIVALFMGGLALGGWFGARYCPRTAVLALKALLINQIFVLLLCILIPLGWVPTFFGPERIVMAEGLAELTFGLWMVLVGLGTGAAFPLVCSLGSQRQASTGRVAGIVDAYDHLGASLGAILPGTFLVPVFGLALSGVVLIVLQGGALLAIIVNLLDLGRKSG
jgi:spermidine synthase